MNIQELVSYASSGKVYSTDIEGAMANALHEGTVTKEEIEKSGIVGYWNHVSVAEHYNGKPRPACAWECRTGHRENGVRLGEGPGTK